MRHLALLLCSLLLLACDRAAEQNVDARDHDAFWLWAGVEPQPVLAQAKSIYILAAEIKGAPSADYVGMRANTPRIGKAKVWLVYRVENLDWLPSVTPRISRDLENWNTVGNDVAGIQIDFDAATLGLADYAAFLKRFRAQLPPNTRLSVTGLLDWSSGGDSPALNALVGTVDEVVLQTYQGRKTIPGYGTYLHQLDRIEIPFRIGLVQGGEWRVPPDLPRNPNFRGYVVFLLNPEGS